MKIALLWLMACLVVTACATNPFLENTERAQLKNSSAAAKYYNELISSHPIRLAELKLFINMMPKGGDLHHHYSGSLYAETYLEWLKKQNYCVYQDDNAETNGRKFEIEKDPSKLARLAKGKKKGQKKVCLTGDEIQENNRFYRELLTIWSNKDYYNRYHLLPPPDQQFFDTFEYFGNISGYNYSEGLNILKIRAKQENVQYIETMLKSSPTFNCPPKITRQFNALNEYTSPAQIEQAFSEFYDYLESNTKNQRYIREFVQSIEDAATGIDDDQFKLRFLSYVSRNSKPDKIFSGLYSSFAADKASQKIVGVGFVGPENGYVALRDHYLHMKMFRFLKAKFPNAKLSMHAGELVLGMVPPEALTTHMNEAIHVAGANRIGHGIDIAHETDALSLLHYMREKDIAVEVNLTSNAFILGVKNEAHPLQLYRTYAVPFVISTDDSGVSRSNLSNEYLLYVSRYKPSYEELKQVVYNSILYSFLSYREKKNELASLNKRFDEFEHKYW